MQKKAFQIFVVFVVIAFAATTFSPALASNNCQVQTSASTGPVPFETEISVVGAEGATFIQFGDHSDDATGRTASHIYYAVSLFKITVLVNGNDGSFYRCHAYVTVLPYDDSDFGVGPGEPGFEIPSESDPSYPSSYEGYIPVGSVELKDSLNDNSSDIDVRMGDGNVAPVINGDKNSVTIEGDETNLDYDITVIQIVQPEPKVETALAPEPVKLTFGQRLWQLIISPTTAFLDGLSATSQSFKNSLMGPELSSFNK